VEGTVGRRFVYRARDVHGRLIRGEVTAHDRLTALHTLREQRQLYVVACEPTQSWVAFARTVLSRSIYWWYGMGIPNAKLLFYRQLAMFLKHGLPTERALEHCIESAVNPRLRATLRVILSNIVGGDHPLLSEAAAQHPDDFSQMEIALFRAGEGGVGFAEVLLRLSTIFSRRRRVMMKLSLSSIYPAAIVVAVAGFIIFVATFFVPKFTTFAATFGEAQPGPMRTLVALAAVLLDPLLVTLAFAAFLGSIVLLRRVARIETVAYRLDQWFLAARLIGPIRRKLMMAGFARTFAALYNAAVPLPEVYELAGRAVASPVYQRAIRAAARPAVDGKGSMAECLRRTGQFDGEFLALVAAGEETKALVEALEMISVDYEHEADERLDTAVKLLEPVLITVAMSAVFSVVIAVYSSIYSIIPHMNR
jgi:type IV pilus assembly protein PilC